MSIFSFSKLLSLLEKYNKINKKQKNMNIFFRTLTLARILGAMANDMTSLTNVIGGREIDPQSRPYLVKVGISEAVVCDGSVITPTVVLTAGHCVMALPGEPAKPIDTTFVEYFNAADAGFDRIYANTVIVHPEYRDAAQTWLDESGLPHLNFFSRSDFALVFLLQEMSGTTLVELNREPNVPRNVGDLLELCGWGLIADNAEPDPNPALRSTTTGYVPNDQCRELHEAAFGLDPLSGGDIISDDMMCASFAVIDEPIRGSACHGDSGKCISCVLVIFHYSSNF